MLLLRVFHNVLGCFSKARLLPEPSLECLRIARFHLRFVVVKFMANRDPIPFPWNARAQPAPGAI